jgi:hypothetical protein
MHNVRSKWVRLTAPWVAWRPQLRFLTNRSKATPPGEGSNGGDIKPQP